MIVLKFRKFRVNAVLSNALTITKKNLISDNI